MAGYGRIRQDTAGYGRIRQDTTGYGRIRQDTAGYAYYRNTVVLGKPQWLSAVVLTLPSKAGAGISVSSVVVSPDSRAFPGRQESVLAFGLLENGRFECPQYTWPALPSSR